MNPYARRRHVLPALALLGVTTLAACGGGGGAETAAGSTTSGATDCPFEPDPAVTTTARIAYQNIPNGDLVVKDQAMLENCMPNADITWSKFDSGGDVIQAFGSDSADIGLVGSSPATRGLSAPLNIPLRVVWVQDVIGEAESLVARDTAVKEITDLTGKTIAVAFSSTAHFSLLQALEDAGMDATTDVTLINLSPDKMPSAWQGGQIDAAWVWDPTLSVLKKTGTVVMSSADTAAAGKPTYDLSAATAEFIDANPEFMSAWAKAQDAAVTQIEEQPDEAALSIAVELGITPDEVTTQFAGYEYLSAAEQAGADYLGGKLAKDLEQTAGFLLTQGGIDAVSPAAAYTAGVDAEPAASVQ